MADLVAAANEEGTVTLYSSQGLDQLNALGDAFEEQYPEIDVEVVRGVDGDIIPRLETEMSTGTSGADLVVMAAPHGSRRTPTPATSSTRRPARSWPAWAPTTPRSTSTRATTSRSAPPC